MKTGTLNYKKLWLLMTLVFSTALTAFYYGDVIENIKQSNDSWRHTQQHNRVIDYNNCLKDNDTSYMELYKLHSQECKADLSRKDYELFGSKDITLCVQAKSKECNHILFIVSNKQKINLTLQDRINNAISKLKYYFESSYSKPFVHYISLLFFIPLVLYIGPSVFTALKKWLHT